MLDRTYRQPVALNGNGHIQKSQSAKPEVPDTQMPEAPPKFPPNWPDGLLSPRDHLFLRPYLLHNSPPWSQANVSKLGFQKSKCSTIKAAIKRQSQTIEVNVCS